MKNDLADLFEACIDGTLDQVELEFEDNAARMRSPGIGRISGAL